MGRVRLHGSVLDRLGCSHMQPDPPSRALRLFSQRRRPDEHWVAGTMTEAIPRSSNWV